LTENKKKMLKWEKSRNGVEIDLTKLVLSLESSLELNKSRTADAALSSTFGAVQKKPSTAYSVKIENKMIEPKLKENEYGIKEYLNRGWSNFAKSDPARLHNIYAAINKLNNLMIKPDENFSLGKALAPFTNANGYVDGMVIKGKKIVPETGGGMCQLGTTMFRAAMNSGMPITERRNHSLWLKYYNDPKNGNPGTDATIYENAPDLKFKNDTGNYLMLKAYGTASADLIIEIWGTKDGRVGTYTAPQITNLIIPETDEEVETVVVKELKPGERNCNGPFKGASTVFTYTIKRADGKVERQTFNSYYKPQKLICQVGADVGYFDN
jgi:vancomycin resistance protein YoaR